MLLSRVALIIIVIALSVLASCGFKPLYNHNSASGSAILQQFSLIRIEPIEDRIGQQLRNYLQDKITPAGVPEKPIYNLTVLLEETRSDMVILRDATSTFAKLKINARYHLTKIDTGKILTRNSVEAATIFNIVESEFANLRAQEDARRRAVNAISESIKSELAIFFLP